MPCQRPAEHRPDPRELDTFGAGMRDGDEIQMFLATVRRRLLLRSGLEAAGYGLGALGLGLLGLGLTATAVGPASFWPIVTGTFCVALALAAVAFGVLLPARALRGDRAAARRTGMLAPRLASDLLSVVELADAAPDPRLASSAPMVRAFRRQVAKRHRADLARTAGFAASGSPRAGSRRIGRRAADRGACGLAAGGARAANAGSSPVALRRRGRLERCRWSATCASRTATRPTRAFRPARSRARRATSPPSRGRACTSRPTRCGPRAMRRCCWARRAPPKSRPVLAGDKLTADFTLTEDAIYRFWLEPAFGRAIREERPHHLTRRERRAPAGRHPGPRRSARAGDTPPHRDRVFGQRRLRAWSRRPGLPGRRPARATPDAARGGGRDGRPGAHAVGSRAGPGRRRRRAGRLPRRGARPRCHLGPEESARRGRCTWSFKTRTTGSTTASSGSATCSSGW